MTTVLLLMDFQNGIAGRHSDSDVVDRAAEAAAAARAAGVPVAFVRVAFRPGFPEVADSNRRFSAIAASAGDSFTESAGATQIVEALGRRDDEPIVTKRRISAFAGSDLEVLLRGLNADRLVLSGISTSGVVLSTLRQAADLDFRLTVLADACADGDEEVHRVLTTKVFPMQAEVTTVAAWAASLRD